MRITVKDDGAGMDEEKLQAVKNALNNGEITSVTGKGMALSNVKKRLYFYYKEELERKFTISSRKNEGTTVTIEVPINRGDL
jgi:two-component system sensor histidine kinase YesM